MLCLGLVQLSGEGTSPYFINLMSLNQFSLEINRLNFSHNRNFTGRLLKVRGCDGSLHPNGIYFQPFRICNRVLQGSFWIHCVADTSSCDKSYDYWGLMFDSTIILYQVYVEDDKKPTQERGSGLISQFPNKLMTTGIY